jgi:hypothetical protein
MVAFFRIDSRAGQAAVSHSLPNQEDLTFWANHNGLIELDVAGQVGFGDMARVLMRRRANRERFRAIRRTFTFPSQDVGTLDTPDLFRAEIRGDDVIWRNKPNHFVITKGRIFNLPLTVVNRNERNEPIQLRFGESSAQAQLPASTAAAFFLKIVETNPIQSTRTLALSARGRDLEAAIALDVREPASLRVELRDEHGAPTAARVYLTAADGLAYAPHGTIARYSAMSAESYFHAPDSFELALPAGETRIEATRGQEYLLAAETIRLQPGEKKTLTLHLRRWIDMAARGWYSADSHIHANYTAPHHQVITPTDVRLQTLAEDLNNANMMVANSSGAFIHDEAFFEGKPHSLSRQNYVIYWNEEMRNSGLYGHMSFFNLKSLVRPIYTGFRDTPHWEDYPPNHDTAKGAQAQGGAVTYVHPGYAANMDGASARELPVDLALGQIDAMDVLSNNPEEIGMEIWYKLLNCGFHLGISAGTDSFTNVSDHYTPGGGRVYVHVDGPMNYQNWIANYKRGRSFSSNGPVILFALNGQEPGAELQFPEGTPTKVRVRATVLTQFPLDTVDLIVNGRPVVSRPVNGKDSITVDEEISLYASSWVAVRALGPWHRMILNDLAAFAHTSPVYVRFGDRGTRLASDIQFYIDWIDQLILRTGERGSFATPERRAEVLDLFRRAQAVYRQRLNEARR